MSARVQPQDTIWIKDALPACDSIDRHDKETLAECTIAVNRESI